MDLGDIVSRLSSLVATTLYVANGGDTDGVLAVSDCTHTADLAIIGDYPAALFETSTGGHSGTMLEPVPEICTGR